MKEGEKRIIFHIDVNNAFLSWTAVKMLKDGEKLDIRKIPSVIGGEEKERHGIVLAKSMPAKSEEFKQLKHYIVPDKNVLI